MLNLGEAAAFTAQDRCTQEIARTSAAVATVPVQLPHHVDWRLRRRLIEPLYGFRPSLNGEEILGGPHISAGWEVLSSQTESRYVALSCNTKQERVGSKNGTVCRHQIQIEWDIRWRLITSISIVAWFGDKVPGTEGHKCRYKELNKIVNVGTKNWTRSYVYVELNKIISVGTRNWTRP
jgi:hypothetical protein